MSKPKLKDLFDFYSQLDQNHLQSPRNSNHTILKTAEQRKNEIWSLIKKDLNPETKKQPDS